MNQQNKQEVHHQDSFQIIPQMTEQEQALVIKQHRQRLHKFYSQTQTYSIQKWYEALKTFTFISFPFEITNIEAYYLSLLYHTDPDIMDRSDIVQASISLKNKVDQFLFEHFPNGCFMKLSTRSPKDSGWDYQNEEVKQSEGIKLAAYLKDKISGLDKAAVNIIYRYFLQESKQKIKIKTGDEFIAIFSRSERIQIDINDLAYLRDDIFGQLKKNQNDQKLRKQTFIAVWGRQWVKCSWMQQFRCFYHNYKLTAITQYDQRCYFPELQNKDQLIKQKISSFFEQILPKLKLINLSSGVMDVIFRINDPSKQVSLIQINIFDYNSRASLFSWDKQKQLLQNGPLQVRYLKSQIQISKWQLTKLMGMIQKGVDGVIEQAMRLLSLSQEWAQFQ